MKITGSVAAIRLQRANKMILLQFLFPQHPSLFQILMVCIYAETGLPAASTHLVDP